MNLSFTHLNIRSLPKSFDLFSGIISGGHMDRVIGLWETWLSPNISDYGISIDGFSVVRSDRVGRGGGVAFYIRNGIKFKLLSYDPQMDDSLEEIWLEIEIAGKKISVGSLYRLPDKNWI